MRTLIVALTLASVAGCASSAVQLDSWSSDAVPLKKGEDVYRDDNLSIAVGGTGDLVLARGSRRVVVTGVDPAKTVDFRVMSDGDETFAGLWLHEGPGVGEGVLRAFVTAKLGGDRYRVSNGTESASVAADGIAWEYSGVSIAWGGGRTLVVNGHFLPLPDSGDFVLDASSGR